MTDKNLSLGTLFTGRVDKTFQKATRTLLKVTNDLVRSMNKLQGAMKGVSSASTSYTKKLDRAAAATGRVGKKADFAGKQIAKVRGAWERMTAAMKVTAAYGIASAVLYSMVLGVKAGIKEIIDFDQALKNLQAITRATDREVSSMGNVMKEVAAETKFSTGEIAEGMVLLGQAGFSATESLQAIQATADLATGTLSSMALTADLLTTAVRAFGLEAIESSRVADVMANAINRSKLTIDKLRIAFNFVGAAAAQTGLSIEQTAASMMILANHGLRASTIGTGMRQVLSRLLAPNRKLREEFEAYGIALDKVNPRLVGFEQAMMRLAPILFDNKRKVVDMGKAYALFGLRGAQAAAVLVKAFLSTGAHSYGAMLEKVYEFGAAADMAATQAEGLGVKFKNLADRAKLMFIALGEAGLTDLMKGFVDALRVLATTIAKFLESAIGKAVVRFAAFSGAIYLVVKALMLFKKHMELIYIATVLGTQALNPWIIAIGAAAAALVWLYKRSGEAIKEIEKQADKVKKSTSALDLYSKTLMTLKSKYDEGKDVQLDYLNTLKHLLKAVPELKDQIKFSTKAWDENAKAIEKVLRLKLKESIEKNTELIHKYREAQKLTLFWSGVWIKTVELAKKALDWWASSMLKIIMIMPRLASKFILKLIELFSKLSKEMSWIPVVGKILGMVGKDLEDLEGKITSYFENLGKGSEKFKDFEGKLTESMKIIGVSLHGLGFSFEAIEKRLLALGASAEQVKEVIDHIKNLQWEFGKIDPPDGVDTTAAEALNLARRYQRLLTTMEGDTRDKIKEVYKGRLLDIQKWHKDRITLLKKTMKDIKAIEQIANRERDVLLRAASEERNRKTLEFETLLERERLSIKVINAKKALEIEKQNAVGKEELIRGIAKKVRKLEIETAEDILKIEKGYLQKVTELYDSEHKKVRDAKKGVAKAELDLEKAKTKSVTVESAIRIMERRRELRDLLENTEKTSEAYVALLDEAYQLDLINTSEYIDQKTALTETWFENFKYGLERSKKDLKSWGEVFQDIGKDIKEVFADELTDSFMDFMDNTKSAGEAFEDFARNMIKWISEIIIKQTILNMLTGVMGMFGGAGLGDVSGHAAADMAGGGWVFHKGGIVGVTPAPVRMVNPNVFANAKKAHMGLAPDERSIIAKKDEGVFTPEQMARLGGTHIETNINIEDERLATKIQYGIEQKIREILREEMR